MCGIYDSKGGADNLWTHVLATTAPADYVVVKLDIDSPELERLAVPVRFDMISEQKRDETKPTGAHSLPLNAHFWSKRCDRHAQLNVLARLQGRQGLQGLERAG